MCRRVQGSQIFIELSDWFKSYCNSSDLGFLSSGGWGRWVGDNQLFYMSSGMFRGKESLNRIKLSRLVQDLLNFAVLGSLRLWGGGRWVGGCQGHLGAWGGVPPHTHMHAHAHTCTYTHVYMYRNCKWPPTWRHPCLA